MKLDWKIVLKYGLFVSLFFNVVVIGGLYIDATLFIHAYPQAIQKKAVLMHTPSSVAQILLAVILWGGIVFLLVRANQQVNRRQGFHFVANWLAILLILELMSISDILIADWLVFATITPDFIVFPGTHGMPEYKDYWFHVKEGMQPHAHLVLLVISLVVTVLSNLMRIFRRKPTPQPS